jgi:hypothetical protein
MDVYKREFVAFEKLFRDASAAFASAMDRGISSTMIEREYHELLAQLSSADIGSSDGALGEPTRRRQKSIVTMQVINNNSQKLVNWLLSSDQQRKESTSDSTIQTLEVSTLITAQLHSKDFAHVCSMKAAEMARRKCLSAWQHAEQSLVNMYQTTQSVLTEYQVCFIS